MSKTTESGKYTTYQSENGKWYYHPTDNDWLAFNSNEEFSHAYTSEQEAIDAAELCEEMDEQGIEGPIVGADGQLVP